MGRSNVGWTVTLVLALACNGDSRGDESGGSDGASSTSASTTGASGEDATGEAGTQSSDTGTATRPGETSTMSGADTTSADTTSAETTSEVTDATTDTTATTGADECPGDAFTDPHGDGSLRLAGDDVFVLGPGPYDFSWICVQDNARLLVCDETTVTLAGGNVSVIGGGGLGPALDNDITVNLNLTPGIEDTYLYFDATSQAITVWFMAMGANLTYALTGTSGVTLNGGRFDMVTYQGGGPEFPSCP